MDKMDFRKLSSQERNRMRMRALDLIKGGKSQREVAILFGVRPNTVNEWMKAYRKEGAAGLKDKSKAHKTDQKLLDGQQQKAIQALITDTMPNELGLPYSLWTRRAVIELVEREFDTTLALTTMGEYLRSWGYTPQKPKKQAYEQCSKKVQRWLDEEYPAIEEKAKAEGGQIHWGDETGIVHDNQHGRSYAPKGRTPVKKSTAKRISINMISTVTNQGLVSFMIYSGRMNSQQLIRAAFREFMAQLIKDRTEKIFLILDNLKVHHSKLVKEWLEGHLTKIEVFYLPAYSPEKNPDEYLNCDLKQGLSLRPSPRSEDQLRKDVENHMQLLQARGERVRRYFNHKDIRYAA